MSTFRSVLTRGLCGTIRFYVHLLKTSKGHTVDSRGEGGGGMEREHVFQKFLNKPIERESDFGGQEYFQNSMPPRESTGGCVPKT